MHRQRIKDHINEFNLYWSRVVVASVFVVIVILGLLSRLVYLQIIEFEKYEIKSNKNRIQVEAIPPKRGLIYDKNGVLLAENRSVYTLEIVPEKTENLEKTLQIIDGIVSISEREKERFMESLKANRRFKSIVLKSGLNEDEVARFSVQRHRVPAATIEARLVRYYPFGDKLVHALGYVGRINDRELQTIDQNNYLGTRHIGKSGLEKYYESTLHGKVGFREVEKDVLGRVIRVIDQQPPMPGEDLHLYLDVNLQLKAEAAMDGRRGAIVAVDPKTGGILALVSTPGFDGNEFVQGISIKSYRKLSQSQDKPLFNRALLGQYPPGSTIKPHIGILGLQQGQISKSFKIPDPGWYQLPNDEHKYRDHAKYGHGLVDLETAIVVSCDTYYYDLAYRLGIDKIEKAMKSFGFGLSTGIDISEENTALMPSRAWKKERRRQPWFPGETVITGIGQGFWTATPLQLANAAAVIANKNLQRFDLSMVKAIEDTHGILSAKPPKLAELQVENVEDKNIQLIRKAMFRVNHDSVRGTARTAFANTKYKSAGKTGTAQLVGIAQDEEYDADAIDSRLRDNAMYIGYAPFDDPQIAIAVVVENGGGGGGAAAPVARKMMDLYLKQKEAK